MYKMKMAGVSGTGYFMFKDGVLRTLFYEFQESLYMYLPQREHEITEKAKFWNERGVTFEELKARTTEEKLALFCAVFKDKRGSGYTPKQNEKHNIKQVMVTERLLKTYFENTTYPLSYAKSVNDYIRNYNYVRDIDKNGAPVSNPYKFPAVYDPDFEKKLNGPALSDYRAHLRDLGWRFDKELALWKKI
jgi:hypothetical protein